MNFRTQFFRTYLFAFLFLLFPYFSYSNLMLISLNDHLDVEKLSVVERELKAATEPMTCVLIINSKTGDLDEVIHTAKIIYEYKVNHDLKVIVYIDGNALGPSAIFPFLSDELYTSTFAVWGDIPLGSEDTMGLNVLKSEISSLIPTRDGKLLQYFAYAMIDPSQIGNLVKLIQNETSQEINTNFFGSKNDQTLVLNQSQISLLHLNKDTLPLTAFEKKFKLNKNHPPSVIEDKLSIALSKYIKINDGNNIIGHIAVNDRNDSINQSTWIYIKSALDHYKKIKPSFIILELNTPGGEVFAAQTISDALKEMDQQYGIPIIAYINDWAISAGAMLAYSCRFITTVENGSMGAAEPVILSQEGVMQSASEKVNSALRKDFANRAHIFGRNPDIAEAMVDKDIILVLRNHKIIRLESKDQIRLKGPNPDIIISNESKLLTLNGDEMVKYGVADAIVSRQGLVLITDQEKAEGKWPFSKEPISKIPFFNQIKNGEIDAYRMDWKTSFFSFLATPFVSSLLMLGLIVGFYLEFSMPGFGLPGIVSLTCLILIIVSNLSLEIANIFEVILVFVGLSLILIEIFLFPTAGMLLVIGFIFFLGGLFAVFLPNIGQIDFEQGTQTLNAAGEEFFKRLAILSITLVIAFVIIMILAYYFTPSRKLLNRFILKGGEQEASLGYVSGITADELPPNGSIGQVFSTLRPSGKVIVDEKIFDAMSEGDFIEEGEEIIVDRSEGSVIFVRKKNEC